jgi:hypothetical protein
MILQNAFAHALRQPKPHSVPNLNALRTALLRDEFFNGDHQTTELRPRNRGGRILFTDLVVLLARLLKVLILRGPNGEGRTSYPAEELRERIEVRNLCLDQPFFDRERRDGGGPFGGDSDEEGEVGDEGCVV